MLSDWMLIVTRLKSIRPQSSCRWLGSTVHAACSWSWLDQGHQRLDQVALVRLQSLLCLLLRAAELGHLSGQRAAPHRILNLPGIGRPKTRTSRGSCTHNEVDVLCLCRRRAGVGDVQSLHGSLSFLPLLLLDLPPLDVQNGVLKLLCVLVSLTRCFVDGGATHA